MCLKLLDKYGGMEAFDVNRLRIGSRTGAVQEVGRRTHLREQGHTRPRQKKAVSLADKRETAHHLV